MAASFISKLIKKWPQLRGNGRRSWGQSGSPLGKGIWKTWQSAKRSATSGPKQSLTTPASRHQILI